MVWNGITRTLPRILYKEATKEERERSQVQLEKLQLKLYDFQNIFLIILFLKKILYIYFLEREREGEREGEKHQCVVASHILLTGDLACNPGMCPRLGIEPATLCSTGRH